MASQFIGLYMRVALREPHGYQLKGIVQDVEAGASLTLVDVTTVAADGTPQYSGGSVRIDATKIADLSEIGPAEKPPTYAPTATNQPNAPNTAPATTRSESQTGFVDPAIVSLGRRPESGTATPRTYRGSQAGIENVSPHSRQPDVLSAMFQAKASQQHPAVSGIVNEMQALSVEPGPIAHELDTANAVGAPQVQSQKKKKTRTKRTQQQKSQHGENDGQPMEGSPAATVEGGRGKGWRQTPILQSTSSFQPFKALKRNGKKALNDNGWASEDVTEEMGEFDFENNLAKFDKRTIFDQMRKDDEVDEEDRLVSHNRRPRPLTAGGKNLHPSENVLDVPPAATQGADFWNSEAEVGVNGMEKSSSREARGVQALRRNDSRSGAARRSQSRKASGVAGSTAGIAAGGLPLSRVNSNVRPVASPTKSTPRLEQQRTNTTQQQGSQQSHQPGLYLLPSNRRVEAISTLQMLNLENIAANELGYTEDLMAENAGRGIAEVAITALSDPALKVRFELAVAGSTNGASVSNSTVVVLASNNKSSIRALAAARHLRNKGIHVAVCLVGVERERDLLEDLRRQIQLYRNFGGKVVNKNDFFEHLRKGAPSGGRIPVSLIIDALLGLTISFEELRVGDQASVYELMEWANRNEAYVLSVDVPTGIDPATGKISIIDGGQLFVKPRYVVAIGVPKRGLLEAVMPPDDDEPGASSNPAQEDEWRLFIADLGLGSAVWRKAGTKMRRGVEFDGRWVLEMQYRGAPEETQYDDE